MLAKQGSVHERILDPAHTVVSKLLSPRCLPGYYSMWSRNPSAALPMGIPSLRNNNWGSYKGSTAVFGPTQTNRHHTFLR